MHAYLLIGRKRVSIEKEAERIASNKSSRLINFPINKIDDVREFKHYAKYALTENTTYLIEAIDKVGNEALNAFLKILEEPQEKMTFILTSENEHRVLPTILSRCEVVRLQTNVYENDEGLNDLKDFMDMSLSQKFLKAEKLKRKDAATEYLEGLYLAFHSEVVKGNREYLKNSDLLENIEETFANLNANGNVSLQLTNFIIKSHPKNKNPLEVVPTNI